MHTSFESIAGAAMVEMSLGILVFMSALGGMFDLGLGLYCYMLFANSVATSVRTVGAELAQGQPDKFVPCSVISTRAAEILEIYVKERVDSSFECKAADHLGSNSCVIDASMADNRLKVTGRMRLNCIFCNLIGKALKVSVDDETFIDTNVFGCTT